MSIMSQLEFAIDFSTSEKEISKYLLDNGENVLNMTIKELANNTFTSPATIVRLTRKIGLDGFSDFKIKYSAELQANLNFKNKIDVNYPFTPSDSIKSVTNKISKLHQESISDTMELFNYNELEKISNLLDTANKIFIFGYGNSLLAGLEFQHKMLRIGKFVEIRSIAGEQVFMNYACKKGDIVIFISYSGETSEIVEQAKSIKKRGISTLGITSLGDNQLSKYCNYIINTTSREKIFNKIAPYSSKTSISFILDVLFSLLFQKNYEVYMNNKLSNDIKFDQRHPLSSPINDQIKEG